LGAESASRYWQTVPITLLRQIRFPLGALSAQRNCQTSGPRFRPVLIRLPCCISSSCIAVATWRKSYAERCKAETSQSRKVIALRRQRLVSSNQARNHCARLESGGTKCTAAPALAGWPGQRGVPCSTSVAFRKASLGCATAGSSNWSLRSARSARPAQRWRSRW
jgi:hypothetical protein